MGNYWNMYVKLENRRQMITLQGLDVLHRSDSYDYPLPYNSLPKRMPYRSYRKLLEACFECVGGNFQFQKNPGDFFRRIL